MKKKDYTLSLTINTKQVGWACILPDNRILKYNNKLAFGVHEFPEAQTSESRRLFRASRRNKSRTKKRLQLIQEAFEPILNEEYPGFLKLDKTHVWQNDSTFNHTLESLLLDMGQSPAKYPTLYHVRNELINSYDKKDIRLVFIAIYNLAKNRGNFNFNGRWGENNQEEVFKYWGELLAAYKELVSLPYSFDSSSYEDLDRICSQSLTNKEKLALVSKSFDKSLEPLISAILDMSVPLHKLFPMSENYGIYKENKVKIQLSNEQLETELLPLLTEHEQLVVQSLVQVQQVYQLQQILGDFKTIAEAKVHAYDVYTQDLAMLKKAFNSISEAAYRDMFISPKEALKAYKEAPSDTNFKSLCRLDRFNETSKEDESFYKHIRQTLLKASEGTPHRAEILDKIERGSFLNRLRGRFNSAIPVQNTLYEIQCILRNQQTHHAGITDALIEQVLNIVKFKIPFYIGPIGNGTSPHEWLVRNTDERITPQNFNESINHKLSNENWMKTLIGDCSFVIGEKVLPDNSLIYQEFKLLNELNVIQLRLPNESPSEEARLPQEVKFWLVENLFKQKKKVTHKAFIKALQNSPYEEILVDAHTGEMKQVFGTSKPTEFANSLSSWVSFSNILGDLMDPQMVEDIIYWLSIYSEPSFVRDEIQNNYPFINEATINKILALTINGWGNVSYKFINGIPVNANGKTIIEAMRSQCVNTSMLQSQFEPYLKAYNHPLIKTFTKFRYEQVEALAGSKAIKRGIWRTLKLVEEISKLFGEPKNIVLKVEREPVKVKKRSKTRKEQWLNWMKAIPRTDKETRGFFELYAKEPEQAFKNDAFWLYLTQLGRCAFTGKTMDFKNGIVAKILPSNSVYDDSLSNKALIHKDVFFARKQGQMPLEMLMPVEAIRVKTYWEQLHNLKLITQTKYYRLLKETFTEEDSSRALEQQLVERRQIVKHVETLLRNRFTKSEVYTVKNAVITAFRKSLDMPRAKDLNNKHLAMDALLAALLVQFSVKRYGNYIFNFEYAKKDQYEQVKQMLQKFQKHFFLFKDFLEEGAFTHKSTNKPIDVKAWLEKVNDSYEWQSTKMRGSQDAAFYDQTIYSPKLKEPAYESSKLALGVHSSLKKAAVYAVEWIEKKGNKETLHTKLIDLTNIEAAQWKHLSTEEVAYLLAEKVASKNAGAITHARILHQFVKGQKILLNDEPFLITSSKELENAKPLHIPLATMKKHFELLNLKEWDNELAIELFKQFSESAIEQLGHILTDSNKAAILNYVEQGITDQNSYLLGYNELMRACNCSPNRSTTLNFGGRIVKTLKYEDIKIINESLTGLISRKNHHWNR